MAASRAEGEEPRRGGRAGGEEPRRGGRAGGEEPRRRRRSHAVCSGGAGAAGCSGRTRGMTHGMSLFYLPVMQQNYK